MQEMQIKNITKTKYGYNVFIDDFKINFEEMIVFKYRFKKGQTLSTKLLEAAKKENELEFIKRKSLVYLGRKRSVLQFKTYLRTLNASEDYINSLAKDYKEKGYLDDYSYAKSVINNLELKYGKRRIYQRLVNDGIYKDIIKDLLTDYKNPYAEQIIASTAKKIKAVNYNKAKQKALRALLAKGFALEEINFYLPKYLKKENYDEKQTIVKDYLKLNQKYQNKLQGAVLVNKLKSLLYQRGYSKEAIEKVLRR